MNIRSSAPVGPNLQPSIFNNGGLNGVQDLPEKIIDMDMTDSPPIKKGKRFESRVVTE